MMVTISIGYVTWFLGSLISLGNFYNSFIRLRIYKIKTGSDEGFNPASNAYVVGSFLVGFGVFALSGNPLLFWLGIIIIMMDTGGIHWLLVEAAFEYFNNKKE